MSIFETSATAFCGTLVRKATIISISIISLASAFGFSLIRINDMP
jgi:hypothetical protein